MTSATELQRSIAGFLRQRRDLTKNEAARRFAELHLGGNERLSPVQQLEIYREQFWLRHTASLLEDFPGVSGVLGQSAWNELVCDYLESDVLASYSLRDLGDGFAAFIATRPAFEAQAIVGDMARLEWAHVEVFDADDSARLDPTKLAAVPEDAWERARLLPDPALRLLALDHPVVALRHRLLIARERGSDEAVPLPEREPTLLAVHRRERVIAHDPLDHAQFCLLSSVMAGSPLGQACESAAAECGISPEDLGADLETWFGSWAARGYLIDIAID
jgi:hypothetical protein